MHMRVLLFASSVDICRLHVMHMKHYCMPIEITIGMRDVAGNAKHMKTLVFASKAHAHEALVHMPLQLSICNRKAAGDARWRGQPGFF